MDLALYARRMATRGARYAGGYLEMGKHVAGIVARLAGWDGPRRVHGVNVGYWRTGPRDRDVLTAILAQQPEEWRAWLEYHADMLYRVVLCAKSGPELAMDWAHGLRSPMDDERRAAQVAMAALRFLAAPLKEERITITRPRWEGEEAKWIAAVRQEVAEGQS